ncbi:MAG: prepilin-type N-terminal cleavage/methylation domain-containing protein [Phycisphaerae bacterium]|nr:prepilin-type N-terminal cleavage/methylation domain-containing protein [Phycisphaerae bacterium]
MLRITLHSRAVRNIKAASGQPAGRRAGFTLMELMIAIGILGVGMVMVTSVFPAAIKEAEVSSNSIVGTMICENGLNIAKFKFRQGDVTASQFRVSASRPAIDETPAHIAKWQFPADQQRYPFNDTDSPYGYALLLKTCGSGYMILCTAYRKKGTGVVLWAEAPNSTLSGTVNTFTVGNGSVIRLGSPFILYGSGQYGIVTNISGNTITLDRKLSPKGATDNKAIVLQETGEADFSPAIATMITRTGLKP